MRFKKSPQLFGAGRTRAWHYHGSHTPTSPGSILLGIQLCHTKHFRRECINLVFLCNTFPVIYLKRVYCLFIFCEVSQMQKEFQQPSASMLLFSFILSFYFKYAVVISQIFIEIHLSFPFQVHLIIEADLDPINQSLNPYA